MTPEAQIDLPLKKIRPRFHSGIVTRGLPTPKRLEMLSMPEPMSGCWIWIGGLDSDGYGQIYVNGKMRKAHQVSYEETLGPLPRSLVSDHLCRLRCCVNPRHLRFISSGENVLAGFGPCAMNARKTVCNRGHKFDETNTYVYGKGYRGCIICRTMAMRLHYERTKGYLSVLSPVE